MPAQVTVLATQVETLVRANQGPIHITFADIAGPLNLRSLRFDHRLVIEDAVFDDPVDLSDAKFTQSVELNRCRFRAGLACAGMRIEGSLLMNEATIAGGADRRIRF